MINQCASIKTTTSSSISQAPNTTSYPDSTAIEQWRQIFARKLQKPCRKFSLCPVTGRQQVPSNAIPRVRRREGSSLPLPRKGKGPQAKEGDRQPFEGRQDNAHLHQTNKKMRAFRSCVLLVRIFRLIISSVSPSEHSHRSIQGRSMRCTIRCRG